MLRPSRYQLLATDYDDTLATAGRVADEVLDALRRLRGSGRRVVLVTGRELEDLLRVFPAVDVFDRVVAENGAVVHRPATRETLALADPPPRAFVDLLRHKQVTPLSIGRVVIATEVPHDREVLEAIRTMGLELQVIFNKGAVMVLPSGLNKATGLQVVLDELRVSPARVIGLGDAENDHAFLALCGCGVAVANAVESLKAEADIVTRGANGQGVLEIVGGLLNPEA